VLTAHCTKYPGEMTSCEDSFAIAMASNQIAVK
jgi:hypothetical protein